MMPELMGAPMAPPRVVPTRFLAAGWDPTHPTGRFVAADRASRSRPPMSAAPSATARGRCFIRHRPLVTPPPRQLARARAIMGHPIAPKGGMGLCPTRCLRSVGAVAPVKSSASAPLGRVRMGAFRLLARVARLAAFLRPHRTGGAPAPRRGPSGLSAVFRTLDMRPMVLSLPLMAISSRGTSMRPSTRCDVFARATPPG